MNIEKALGLTEKAITDIVYLSELRQYLQDELTMEMAKKSGGQTEKTRFTIAKKYIDYSIKHNVISPFTHGVWYNTDHTYQYITDTFSAFKLSDHIQGLPELPDNTKYPEIEAIMQKSGKYNLIEIPSITDLKIQLKLAQAELKIFHAKERNMVLVEHGLVPIGNSKYDVSKIITCLEILGNDDIKAYVTDSDISVLFLEGNKGEAVLMPINTAKN